MNVLCGALFLPSSLALSWTLLFLVLANTLWRLRGRRRYRPQSFIKRRYLKIIVEIISLYLASAGPKSTADVGPFHSVIGHMMIALCRAADAANAGGEIDLNFFPDLGGLWDVPAQFGAPLCPSGVPGFRPKIRDHR
jgi:hypothetical protein